MITFDESFSNSYSALLPKAECRRPGVVDLMQTDSDMLHTPSPSSTVNQKQTAVAALVTSNFEGMEGGKKKNQSTLWTVRHRTQHNPHQLLKMLHVR